MRHQRCDTSKLVCSSQLVLFFVRHLGLSLDITKRRGGGPGLGDLRPGPLQSLERGGLGPRGLGEKRCALGWISQRHAVQRPDPSA